MKVRSRSSCLGEPRNVTRFRRRLADPEGSGRCITAEKNDVSHDTPFMMVQGGLGECAKDGSDRPDSEDPGI